MVMMHGQWLNHHDEKYPSTPPPRSCIPCPPVFVTDDTGIIVVVCFALQRAVLDVELGP